MHQLVEDEGIDYIALTCSRVGAFFLPRPRQDVGVDGHIEFLDNEGHPTGAIAWIQAKAGTSFVSSSGEYIVRAKPRHFKLWQTYTAPVIGIVYNPERRDARWVNLTEVLLAQPELVDSGPYRIAAPASQPFSEASFAQLQAAMQRIHHQARRQPHVVINDFLTDPGIAKEMLLYELFDSYRWTALACFFFHQAVRIETDREILGVLAYFISFYRHHPDRFYGRHMDNLVPPDLKALAARCIRDFDVSELVKLLSVIDDDHGFERGTLGQVIGIQLYDVSNITTKLKAVVRDRCIDEHARFYAVGILVQYFQDDDMNFYRHLLATEDEPRVVEALRWAIDCIEEWTRLDHTESCPHGGF